MGRMLDAFKQIDQKRGKTEADSARMTQPMPTPEQIADAQAVDPAAPPAEAAPSSWLTGEEIAALGGDQPAPRTVDDLEQEMRELENLLSAERATELPVRLDADPLGLRQAPTYPTEAYQPPAGDGLAHDPAERAGESPHTTAWPLSDGLPEEPLLKLDDAETDWMHAALLEQASQRGEAEEPSSFVMFPGEPAEEPPAPMAHQESTPSVDSEPSMPAVSPIQVSIPPAAAPAVPSEVHWPFVETPLQREDHDRLARHVVDQLPRSLPASLMMIGAGRNGVRLPAVLGLARALAERDEGKVLIVDADAAQREITRRLGLTRAPGLFDLLGQARGTRLTIPTDFEGLDFLPTGGRKTRTTCESLRSLLAELKRTYRFVIVETGAAAPLDDMLSQVADAVYLMIELGVTGREDARKAARRLRQGGACLRGCVLAGMSPSEASVFRPSTLVAHG